MSTAPVMPEPERAGVVGPTQPSVRARQRATECKKEAALAKSTADTVTARAKESKALKKWRVLFLTAVCATQDS